MPCSAHPDSGASLTAVGRRGMRGLLRLVTSIALAALVAGCTSDKARPRTEPSPSASSASYSPSSSTASESAVEKAIARAKAAKVAAFVDQAEPLDRSGVRPGFALDDVQYTSPNDAAATFDKCGKRVKPRSTDRRATVI